MNREKILSVRDLTISFDITNGNFEAIDRLKFDIYEGETVAIVGESGSGKSVTAKAIMGIITSNEHIDAGKIEFTYNTGDSKKTVDIAKMSERQIRNDICGKHIAMVFQDPMTSLNPTVTVGKQIMEGMREHYDISKTEAKEKAIKLLDEVGIDNPVRIFFLPGLSEYPMIGHTYQQLRLKIIDSFHKTGVMDT